MRISILTIFPEMFEALKHSILGKALEKGVIELDLIDIREFTEDKHKKVDDYPFGGGSGMVMMAQPIVDAFDYAEKLHTTKPKRIYMSPRGRVFKQEIVKEFATQDMIILCGHYEGVDQRALDMCVDEEISIGDYVLTGGELAAMVVVDAVSRYVDGVLGSSESLNEESFSDGLLEYPQYTRPADFRGERVPDILLSGHHANIAKWRHDKSLEITQKMRPDLLG